LRTSLIQQCQNVAMSSEIFLGFDVGTSSSKGVAVSADGQVLATAVREHRVERPQPGLVEMDGEICWRELLDGTIVANLNLALTRG